MSTAKGPAAGEPGDGLAGLELVATPRGTVLRFRCRPGRPRTRPDGVHAGALRIDLAAPPEKGKANRELLAWLAGALAVPRGDLAITSGETGRDKSVLVGGVEASEVRQRLAEAMKR